MRLINLFSGAALLLALALAGCGPAAKAVPLEAEKIQDGDGLWLERRVNQYGNGRIEEIWYVYRDSSGNYVRHGEDRHFYRNGQMKFVEHYRHGQLEGMTEFWYQNGAKQGELPFQDGKPHGKAITWFPNGHKKSEKHWDRGKLSGTATEWDKRGRKISEKTWNRSSPEP